MKRARRKSRKVYEVYLAWSEDPTIPDMLWKKQYMMRWCKDTLSSNDWGCWGRKFYFYKPEVMLMFRLKWL